MSKLEATMSAGYQVTVPSALRKLLDLKPGDKLVFDTDTQKPTVEKALSREEQIERVFSELGKLQEEREARMTPEQREFAEMTAGWTVNQYHDYYDNLPESKAYIEEKYGV